MEARGQNLAVVTGGLGDGAPAISPLAIPSEVPDYIAKLSVKERKVWNNVTQALFEYGLVHRTDAMLLTIVCRTFVRWVEAEAELTKYMKEHEGSYFVKTPNGYEQPHQVFYLARNLKRELLQWLPEAALTVPSFHKIVGERAKPEQGSLFEDPVQAHRARKNAIGLRTV